MANVVFRLSTKQIDGKAELLVRFYGSRSVDQRAHTRLYVPVILWCDKTQRLNIPRRFVTPETIYAQGLQERIEGLRSFILERFLSDSDVIRKGWLDSVVAEYSGRRGAPALTPVADVVKQYSESSDLLGGTQRQYQVLAGMLSRYAETGHPLYIEQFNASDVEQFVRFLRSERRDGEVVHRCQNTINSKLRRLRAACKWWCGKNPDCANPFDAYKIPADVYGTPVWLSIDERDRIYKAEMPSESLAVQRDIFVFQCLVGCRVSDLTTLTAQNITPDGFLQFIQRKLRRKIPETIRIPLTETALEILDRYKGQPDGRLLPFISDVKYNVAIKRVLKAAGIDRVVLVQNKFTYEDEPRPIYELAASHLARRTFAANLYKQVKDERLVSSLTGHADGSAALRRYTDVDDDMKRDVISALDKKKNPPVAGGLPQ